MLRTNVPIAAGLAALVLAAPLRAADTDGFRLLVIDGHTVKWGPPGKGATITYAVARLAPQSQGSLNCRATVGVGPLLARSNIPAATFDGALARAFRLWSDVADIRFIPAEKGTVADLTIAAEAVPDGVAYSDVTLASVSGSAAPTAAIARAVVCLNPEIPWSSNEGAAEGSYRLFYVLAHEIGHTIGLDHPGPAGTLMSFEYSRTLAQLQPGDVAGVRSLYGAAQNKSIASLATQN